MRRARILLPAVLAAAGWWAVSGAARPAETPTATAFPKFDVQEIDTKLNIGYAVLTADLSGDKKPDIVVVDQFQVVWYENPTWTKRVILDGQTKPDNVCAAAVDIDGDGKLDLVLGAAWKPFDTATPGTLQWLKNPGDPNKQWEMFPIACDEPTVHRVRVADIDGDGKPEIILAPLMGRDASAKGNWLDGRPVRITAYKIPREPQKKENWKPEVLSEELHVTHNLWPIQATNDAKNTSILVTSYEGVNELVRLNGKWATNKMGGGNQANPNRNRGASEIKYTRIGGHPVIATVEPWHGNQIVTYTPTRGELGPRHIIDEQLRWGHAVGFADLDGDGTDELVIGVRDDPNPKQSDSFTERRGVRIYKCTDGKGAKWERHILENGGVAVEDLTVADLNGDGKPDIIACGRQTKNVRIYWNQGK